MKICFLCNEYPPARHGGVGVATRTISRALVEAGHQVRVIGLNWEDTDSPRVESDRGVKVWRLKTHKSFLGWVRSRRLLYLTVASWAQSGAIDLLEVPDYEGFAAAWPALSVPLVTRLHGTASYFASELGRRPRTSSFLLERAALRRSDLLSSCSSYTAERTRELFRLGKCEIKVLYNPVRIESEFENSVRDPDQVVFSGTLTPKKGIISLVQAWPSVLERCPKARLDIFGKPGLTDSGESMEDYLTSTLPLNARRTVRFHGHVESRRLQSAFRSAAVAVFPSYAEAFALAPMEAMAEGCPTIYSRRGSGMELIEHGRNGFLVNPDNVPEIQRSIVDVLQNPSLGRAIGEEGRKHLEAHFSLSAMLPRYVEFYLDCIRFFRDRNSTRLGRSRAA